MIVCDRVSSESVTCAAWCMAPRPTMPLSSSASKLYSQRCLSLGSASSAQSRLQHSGSLLPTPQIVGYGRCQPQELTHAPTLPARLEHSFQWWRAQHTRRPSCLQPCDRLLYRAWTSPGPGTHAPVPHTSRGSSSSRSSSSSRRTASLNSSSRSRSPLRRLYTAFGAATCWTLSPGGWAGGRPMNTW